MKIERITVRAGRCVPHPLHSYGNLKADLEVVAVLDEGDDPQAIKAHFWPNRIAIEVYPRNEDIVNVANMRWIWILAEPANLPFTIKG
ncbi:hypothetical protein KC887_00355 [Candidatus Kaiserbacteria bacterium]|nr:hypothetical protein [Candidatus Kaiserbacteria bacterium]